MFINMVFFYPLILYYHGLYIDTQRYIHERAYYPRRDCFYGLLCIMNPIANTPIFLSLTGDSDRNTVKAIAFRSVFVAFIIISAFAISGKLIFDLFGITLYALRITGGIFSFPNWFSYAARTRVSGSFS